METIQSFDTILNPQYACARPVSFYTTARDNTRLSEFSDIDVWEKIALQQIQQESISYNELLNVPVGHWLVKASRGGGTLIDYNCGTAIFADALRKLTGFKYVGFERNTVLYRGAKARWVKDPLLEFVLGGFNIPSPFKYDTVGIVWTYGVLSSVSGYDQKQTFQEISNMLRPGGFYIACEKILTFNDYQKIYPNAPVYLPENFSNGNAYTFDGWKKFGISAGLSLIESHGDCLLFKK